MPGARDDEGEVEILRERRDEMPECGCAPESVDLCGEGAGEVVETGGETSGEGTNGLTKGDRRAKTRPREQTLGTK